MPGVTGALDRSPKTIDEGKQSISIGFGPKLSSSFILLDMVPAFQFNTIYYQGWSNQKNLYVGLNFVSAETEENTSLNTIPTLIDSTFRTLDYKELNHSQAFVGLKNGLGRGGHISYFIGTVLTKAPSALGLGGHIGANIGFNNRFFTPYLTFAAEYNHPLYADWFRDKQGYLEGDQIFSTGIVDYRFVPAYEINWGYGFESQFANLIPGFCMGFSTQIGIYKTFQQNFRIVESATKEEDNSNFINKLDISSEGYTLNGRLYISFAF